MGEEGRGGKGEMSELEKGDVVKTPQGYFGKVNWVTEEIVGISYVGKAFSGLDGMTFPLTEVTLVQKNQAALFREEFKEMSDEELRSQLQRERTARTILPTPTQRAAKRKDDVSSILKELSSEDKAALAEFLKAKRGGN